MKPFLAATVLFALIAAPASAACTQGDAAGTWRLFVTGHGNTRVLEWERCTTKVRASGRMAGSSFCLSSAGVRINILSSSRFILKSDCRLRGTINFDGGLTETIVDGQLSIDKTTFAGVATDPGGPSTFVGIKK